MSLDGTCLDVADTPANAAAFGRPGSGRGDGYGAFPQLRVVGLAECGTHAIVAATLGPCTQSEAKLADELTQALDARMLLLADRGLVGAERWRAAQATGAALVWRVQTGRFSPALPVEQPLADGSWLSRLGVGGKSGPPIVVRVLDYSIDDQRPPTTPTGAGQPVIYRLVTSILDPAQAPAVELAALYHQRWAVEMCQPQCTHVCERAA